MDQSGEQSLWGFIYMKRRGDYRIFVGAFPAGELAAEIQGVRERYDLKTARIAPPHVTVWGTAWRKGTATAENEQETIDQLAEVVPRLPSFELVLGGIQTFTQRVVYLDVEESAGLRVVRKGLVTALGGDKHGRQFTPHLTLAMRLKRPQVGRMVADLQASKWEQERFRAPITALQLMQRAPDDPAWRVIGVFALNS